MFMENFRSTLENDEKCESLAQQIFPHLQYIVGIQVHKIPKLPFSWTQRFCLFVDDVVIVNRKKGLQFK